MYQIEITNPNKIIEIRINMPCTIFTKDKKHKRDVRITASNKNVIKYVKNTEKKTGIDKFVDISDISDISYQDE